MARNQVQFQKGLSTVEFNQRYGTQAQCHDVLVKMRWPNGFVCPKCGETKHSYCRPRQVFQCRKCRVQTSVRAGTIFHKSRTPLIKWFLAMHLLTASKNDISALEMSRHLAVKWDTAWAMKQKLMEVMLQRNSIYKLEGNIQIDDAYQGGEKAGKSGRGAANKLPFVIAVQTDDKGRPLYTQLRVVPAFTKEAMRNYAKSNIDAKARVTTDGLSCFNGFAEAGIEHVVKITGGGRPKAGEFKWVNIGLGNVKGAITGTCRSIDARHTPRYLAAYEWRHNRRFDLPANLQRLARVAVTIAPMPYRQIAAVRSRKSAETSG